MLSANPPVFVSSHDSRYIPIIPIRALPGHVNSLNLGILLTVATRLLMIFEIMIYSIYDTTALIAMIVAGITANALL